MSPAYEELTNLGGAQAAAWKLRRYLMLPDGLAGHKKEALYELSLCGRPAVETLEKFLCDQDAERRAIAACALGRIGPDAAEAIPALEVLLRDPDEFTRIVAAQALKRIGRKDR